MTMNCPKTLGRGKPHLILNGKDEDLVSSAAEIESGSRVVNESD